METKQYSAICLIEPAEMIGTKPKSLSLSLYKSLITDSIWCLQRKIMDKNVFPNKLMYNFLGSPYIDLKTDLKLFKKT